MARGMEGNLRRRSLRERASGLVTETLNSRQAPLLAHASHGDIVVVVWVPGEASGKVQFYTVVRALPA